MDPTKLLEADHRTVETLFEMLSLAPDKPGFAEALASAMA